MGGSSSQPQSADKPAEQGAQSSGTAEHQENACSAELRESQRRRQSHLHQMLPSARIQAGSSPAISRSFKVAEGHEDQRKIVEPATEDHLENNTEEESKMGSGPAISRSSKEAEGHEDQRKIVEPGTKDHPENNAGDESKMGCAEYAAAPQENSEHASQENQKPQGNSNQTDNNYNQTLDADQDKPNSEPRSGQQPACESEEAIASRTDEVQPPSTPGAEMQCPEENNVGNGTTGILQMLEIQATHIKVAGERSRPDSISRKRYANMCKSKYSFSLLSIFFVLLMGTSAYALRNSTSHYAGHTDDITEEGGHIDTEVRNGEEKVGIIGSILDVLGKICRWLSELSLFSSEQRRITDTEVRNGEEKVGIIGSILDVLGEIRRWLSELSFFSSEQRRITGPDCAMVKSPKVSEGHGTEDNSKRYNQKNSDTPVRRKGNTRHATLGRLDQSESDIVDNKYSVNEGWRCNIMDKDRQRIGLDENADTCRVNEMEPWPYCALVNSSKVSESHGTEDKSNRCNQKKSYMPIRRKGKTRRAIPGPADPFESDVSDKTSAGDEGRPINIADKDRQRIGLDENADSRRVTKMEVFRAPMGQWTSYVSHAIALLTVLTLGYCALRHRIKQTTYPEDRPDQIMQILARITDLQLYRVTEKYLEQLETEIKDVVENIYESLLSEEHGTELNLEETRKLTRSNQGPVDSQLLLKSVLHGSIRECRRFWNILSRTEVNPQNLLTLLRQDVEEELILQHRYNLRVQSRNMKMPMSRLISDIYTEPRITVTHTEHGYVTEESNNHVGEVEIHELLKRRNSDTDKTNIIVVYGAAGTGKTTLIQKIIHDWARGMIYEDFRFVLHLKVQHLNAIKGRITLSGLIVDTYPYLENYLDELWKKPEGILFIFDDLSHLDPAISFSDDERNSDPGHRCTGPESICFGHDILRCLLQGEFLKGCTVLITARLWEQATLRHLTVDTTFQIMDFSSENVKKYFCSYLGNEQNANRIVQFIEQNDIWRNLCSDPLFCVTLASSLESHQPQREEQTTMPVINHTQLLFDYVVLLLRTCGYDKTTLEYLLEVGKLAYEGITRDTLLFNAGALNKLNFCPPNITSAFMIQDPDKQDRGIVYEFRHSVVRDFLAALAKILNTPTAQLKVLLDDQFTDTAGRFRTFSLFLVGLSSQKSTDHLNLQLGSVPTDSTSCISEWLTKSVNRRLTNMDRNSAQSMFLHILYCLLEFGDNIIMKKVLADITTIKLNQLLLTSLDCTVLSRTLIYSELIEELDLSSSLAQLEQIQKLEPVLHRCVILRLNQNNLQDSGVKRLFNILTQNDCKIQTLELKSNHLTDDCLDIIFFAISAIVSLKQLNLSNSSLDKEHANLFTPEILQNRFDSCGQREVIRFTHKEHVEEDMATSDTASNVLILITD